MHRRCRRQQVGGAEGGTHSGLGGPVAAGGLEPLYLQAAAGRRGQRRGGRGVCQRAVRQGRQVRLGNSPQGAWRAAKSQKQQAASPLSGSGTRPSHFIQAIRSARSSGFFRPANTILVPAQRSGGHDRGPVAAARGAQVGGRGGRVQGAGGMEGEWRQGWCGGAATARCQQPLRPCCARLLTRAADEMLVPAPRGSSRQPAVTSSRRYRRGPAPTGDVLLGVLRSGHSAAGHSRGASAGRWGPAAAPATALCSCSRLQAQGQAT